MKKENTKRYNLLQKIGVVVFIAGAILKITHQPFGAEVFIAGGILVIVGFIISGKYLY